MKDMFYIYYKCPQKKHITHLNTPCNQLTFSVRGRKTFHKAGKTWTVSGESGYLVRNTIFNEEKWDQNGWEPLVFLLRDDYLRSIYNEFRPHLPLCNLPDPPTDMILRMDINDRTRRCYAGLLPYFDQKLPIPGNLVELKLKEIVYNVLINPDNRLVLSFINSLADGYTIPLNEVMEKNYMQDMHLAEYAFLSNRSLSAFKRDFTSYYGISPGKWLIKKRLQRARRLLITSQKRISRIAFETGFKNVSHFSRIFKEHFGESPLRYRHSLSNK